MRVLAEVFKVSEIKNLSALQITFPGYIRNERGRVSAYTWRSSTKIHVKAAFHSKVRADYRNFLGTPQLTRQTAGIGERERIALLFHGATKIELKILH